MPCVLRSEADRELRRDELLALLQRSGLASDRILQLRLHVAVEAVRERHVRAPRIAVRRDVAPRARDVGEDLLVPAQRGEQARRHAIAALDVPRERVRILAVRRAATTRERDLEARREDLRPELE